MPFEERLYSPNQATIVGKNRVPINRSQLEKILKAAANDASIQVFGDSGGQRDIIPLEELRSFFDVHVQQQGRGWMMKDTQAALIQKMKSKLKADGLDS